MRRRTYEILSNPRPDDRLGRFVGIALLLLIAANVLASILETDAELANRAPAFFEWFERVSIPMTPAGRVIGGIVAFVGICAVALPVGIVSSGFIEELNRKRHQTAPSGARTCPHCGGALDE